MVIVDTSVWATHLRKGEPVLSRLLMDGEVTVHPFIFGEIVCGYIEKRKDVLFFLKSLPSVPSIEQEEYLDFVENNKLLGMCLGFVDIHILASARISSNFIYTFDKSLQKAASKFQVAF